MDNLLRFIKELIAQKFYGSLELKFEAGKIVLLRKMENIKLEEVKDGK